MPRTFSVIVQMNAVWGDMRDGLAGKKSLPETVHFHVVIANHDSVGCALQLLIHLLSIIQCRAEHPVLPRRA